MADLAVSSQQAVGAIFLESTRIRTWLAGAGGVTFGQSVYLSSAGTALPTAAGAAGTAGFRGIAIQSVGAGQGVDVIEEGYVNGIDVSALAYDAPVYLSNTAGKLADAAGTVSVIVGRVQAMSDRDAVTGNPSKVLFVRPNYN